MLTAWGIRKAAERRKRKSTRREARLAVSRETGRRGLRKGRSGVEMRASVAAQMRKAVAQPHFSSAAARKKGIVTPASPVPAHIIPKASPLRRTNHSSMITMAAESGVLVSLALAYQGWDIATAEHATDAVEDTCGVSQARTDTRIEYRYLESE